MGAWRGVMQDVGANPSLCLPTLDLAQGADVVQKKVVDYLDSLKGLFEIQGQIVPLSDKEAMVYGKLYESLSNKFRIDIETILNLSNSADVALWATGYHSMRVMAMARAISEVSIRTSNIINDPNFPQESYRFCMGITGLDPSIWEDECPGPVLSAWYYTGAGSVEQTPNGINPDAYLQFVSAASLELHQRCLRILQSNSANHSDVLMVLYSEPKVFEHVCNLVRYCSINNNIYIMPLDDWTKENWIQPYINGKVGPGDDWIVKMAKTATPICNSFFAHLEIRTDVVYDEFSRDVFNRKMVYGFAGTSLKSWVTPALEFYRDQFAECITNPDRWFQLDVTKIPSKNIVVKDDDCFDGDDFWINIEDHLQTNNDNDNSSELDISMLFDYNNSNANALNLDLP